MQTSGGRAEGHTLQRDTGHTRVHVQRRGEHNARRGGTAAEGGRGVKGERIGRRE